MLAPRVRKTEPGLVEVELVNTGDADAAAIAVEVRWSHGRLLAADALRGFRIDRERAGSLRLAPLRRSALDRVAPGGTRPLGWFRFDADTEVEVHAAH